MVVNAIWLRQRQAGGRRAIWARETVRARWSFVSHVWCGGSGVDGECRTGFV